MSSKNILLVEGDSDRGFFENICRMLHISTDVISVSTPKDSGGSFNSKQGVLNHLTSVLLPQLQDGQLERIGVVVDADRLTHGHGYEATLKGFSECLSTCGYLHNPSVTTGLIYEHDDGLADLGLWIMPNNSDEGTVEDWVKRCVHPDEVPLYQHGEKSIDTIPGGPKFQPWNRRKAEVATWLAWQRKPEHGLYNAAQADLLNTEESHFKGLQAWLTHVFAL